MRITWIGNHEEGVMAFRKAIENNGVDAFITLDEAAFDKRSAGSREYIDICEDNGIPYFMVNTIKSDEAYEIIRDQNTDLLVVLGWSEILPERILNIPTIGTVGTHAALLPHNRGSAPINWALIHGEDKTGNTMMWLSKDVDAGAIVDQIEFTITPFDTCKTIYDRVAETNAEMLVKLIGELKKGIRPTLPIKNETDEPILPRRKPKDGLLYWNQSAKDIYNFIRALTKPYPGAFTFLGGKKYLLWEASVLPVQVEKRAGTILGTSYGFAENGCGLVVASADNLLLITKIESEDGREYLGEDLYELNLKGVFENE